MGGTYLVPMRNYCMHGNGLKTLPERDSPALVFLEEGYKDSETQITLSDTWSALVWASCMTFELLGQIPQSLHRLLDCTDGNSVSQALGTNTIQASSAVPFHRVWSKL